ncbi:mandelate racemase/muconate lactonizing enzyme family protein [Haladaptatus sp. YSMS36]|uniref:mandelate racemase/muconate lactonizing enzyme family protein n=1 Tax=Haladaptatus sp. YSMS36 TaxID=3033384 RepID=UPI0023E7B756|nr:mandelate racemase/muconate lactonizing enzyme family protein [Haladaptatus sp. YSMS36]
MEITDVETYTLHLPIDRVVGDSRLSVTDMYVVVVELATDAGYTGTGWMNSLGYAPDLLERFVESQFADLLVGEDPFATEAIRKKLRAQTVYYGELGISAWPRAAIDVACWDIKAQAAGQPLYKLLGGEEDRVRAYASSMDAHHDLDELADLHGGFAEQGFTAFKTKVGDKSPAEEARRIAEVREAVGPAAQIFVDANQAWTVSEAIRTIDAMAAHGLDWVEEPISEFDLAGHRRVVEATEPPLATGEMINRPEQFRYLLDSGGMEIAQPDLVRGGGVTGQMAIANLAATYDVPVATHFYYTISSHIVSAAQTGLIVEYIPEYDVGPVLDPTPVVEDGHVVLPDTPGHGYRIDPAEKEARLVSFD